MCCVLDMEDWKELRTRVLHYIAKKPVVSGIITVVTIATFYSDSDRNNCDKRSP